jgi:hypothetical protein
MKLKFYIHKRYIALAFGALLFLSGCQSAELKALENSTSILQLTTGREVSRWQQDKGVTLGKPDYPEVRIEYEPINNYAKEDVYNEIVGILEENNWERKELSIAQSGYFRASLPQDDFKIVVAVLIHLKSNIVIIQFGTNPH